MLERFWLILIFVLAGLVPQMHAARLAPPVSDGCSMVCCAEGCECQVCQCSVRDPGEAPAEREPAVPVMPEREQKRDAAPSAVFSELAPSDERQNLRPDAGAALRSPWSGVARIESIFCVWRI